MIKINIIRMLPIIFVPCMLNASLFFSEHNLNLIDEVIYGGGDRYIDDGEETVSPKIKLTSILYTDESNWAVWLNDHKLDPNNKSFGRFDLESVTPDRVKLSYLPKGGIKRVTFHLKSQETYDTSRGSVESFTIR